MRVLVTRPQPGADATAAAVRAIGHEAVIAPLLATEAVTWNCPASLPEAVVLSSAASVRHAGDAATALQPLPALCVGEATATAARAAGWRNAIAGPGTMQLLLDRVAATGPTRLLHLAGADRTAVTVPPGVRLDVMTVYRAVLQPLPPDAPGDVVLLYSARTAAHFAAEWQRLARDRSTMTVLAISEAARLAAGAGWRASWSAPQPTEAALLAALTSLG